MQFNKLDMVYSHANNKKDLAHPVNRSDIFTVTVGQTL